MSIESVMPSNHLILCRPLLLPPSIFPSIKVFFNESVLHIRWPNYWSFSFKHQSFQRILGTDFFLCAPGPCYDNRTSVKSVCRSLNPCQYLPKSIFLILAFWMSMNCYIIVILTYVSLISNTLAIFLWAYLPFVHLLKKCMFQIFCSPSLNLNSFSEL